MFTLNKKTILLIALPLLLFALILYAQSRKPRLLPGVGGSITAIAFSPDSQNVVCASNNNYVQIWLPEREKWRSFHNPEVSPNGQPGLCVRLRFSDDGKTLFAGGAATGGSQAYSQVWDVVTRRRKFASNPTHNPVFDVSPDGRWAAASYNDAPYLINLRKSIKGTQKKYHRPKDTQFFWARRLEITGPATCVAFSPDSKILAIGDDTGSILPVFWDVEANKRIGGDIQDSRVRTPLSLEWSSDGKYLAVAEVGGLAVYQANPPLWLKSVAWPTKNALASQSAAYMGGVIPIAWSHDGKTIFTGGDEVRRWRASDLKLEYSYGVSGPVAVSPDGRTLATASWPDPAGPKGVLLWKTG